MIHPQAGSSRVWQLTAQTLQAGQSPLLMGIVNVTPDSFSDGGQFRAREAAIRHALDLAEAGADLLDVGGESTRPGAAPVSLEEELSRVVPVVAALTKETSVPISIDTTKSEVARQCLEAGAQIVNDISGLTWDASMVKVCAQGRAGVICMHIQGTPQTMQLAPHYDDPVREIADYFAQRLAELEAEGIPRERVVLDPGIGFGKTADHNLQILANIARFRVSDRPICIGHSRKRFLGKILKRPVDERLFGTVGVSMALALQGTDILRLHEIAPTRDCLLAWQAIVSRATT